VTHEPERPRNAGRGRGVLLAASVALFIVVGGGAALWSLLREIYAAPADGGRPVAPAASVSPTPGSASSHAPEPPADPAAR
jgi:hypothetical protein